MSRRRFEEEDGYCQQNGLSSLLTRNSRKVLPYTSFVRARLEAELVANSICLSVLG